MLGLRWSGLGLLVLALVCVAAMGLLAAASAAEPPAHRAGTAVSGGAVTRAGPRKARIRVPTHVIVDTLNIAHWLRAAKQDSPDAAGPPALPEEEPPQAPPADSTQPQRQPHVPLSPAEIVEAIDRTAPILKKRYPGRVVYVVKDRESQFNDDQIRASYQAAATRNRVTVAMVERYVDPPHGPAGRPPSATDAREHSARGRDDFYMSILAHRLRGVVLTADALRDFARFRATVAPFRVLEFAYWRELPTLDYVMPASSAYAGIRRPATVHPASVLGE